MYIQIGQEGNYIEVTISRWFCYKYSKSFLFSLPYLEPYNVKPISLQFLKLLINGFHKGLILFYNEQFRPIIHKPPFIKTRISTGSPTKDEA